MTERVPHLFAIASERGVHAMTAAEVTQEAMYQSYAFNRRRTPGITPDQWRLVFGDHAEVFEVRYQQEQQPADTKGTPTSRDPTSPSA